LQSENSFSARPLSYHTPGLQKSLVDSLFSPHSQKPAILEIMLKQETFKVAIVGLGRVGVTTAFSLLTRGLASEILLFSRDLKKAEGEKADLEHGSLFCPGTTLLASTNFEDFAGTDLVIFTAGASQKPGQTRLDLARDNLAILESLIPRIVKHAPSTLILVVSNPLDVMTYRASVLAKLAPGRVFGSGTLLDTSRYRFHLSKLLTVNPTSIHAYLLGEHGDSSFAPNSIASVGGTPLRDFAEINPEQLAWAEEEARRDAYKIIAGKGSTYYGIASAVSHIVDTIARDKKKIVPLSVPLTGQYDLDKTALSLPCVLGRSGIEKILTPPLDSSELEKLVASANVIRSHLT